MSMSTLTSHECPECGSDDFHIGSLPDTDIRPCYCTSCGYADGL